MSETAKDRAERAFASAKRAGRVRREEQDRIADLIEARLWDAKEQETIDALVGLARDVLDPVKR